MVPVKLNSTEYYLNRELCLLAFNRRVLAQAEDERNPLLERLKFLCIVSSNLDEFFEVRVADIKEQIKYAAPGGAGHPFPAPHALERGAAGMDTRLFFPRADAHPDADRSRPFAPVSA